MISVMRVFGRAVVVGLVVAVAVVAVPPQGAGARVRRAVHETHRRVRVRADPPTPGGKVRMPGALSTEG